MKKFLLVSFVITAISFLTSCNTGPKAINYGNDGCHYCKMTIVDKIHGAELVTDKGKVFKFDATECMVNFLRDNPDTPIGSLYTNYYENPTQLTSAKEATFLISESIPSPMGAYLTAFQDMGMAEKLRTDKGGTLYTWEELKKHLLDN